MSSTTNSERTNFLESRSPTDTLHNRDTFLSAFVSFVTTALLKPLFTPCDFVWWLVSVAVVVSSQERTAPECQPRRISTEPNIPISAVMILFSCHEEVLTTDEIPLQSKKYITEHLFKTYSNLRENERLHCLADREFMLCRLKATVEGQLDKEYDEISS